MEHRVPHDLGREKAKEVAEAAFKSYQQKFAEYKPTANWVSDSRCEIAFSVKGKKLTGVMTVNPKDIGLDLDVPFIFRPFKGKAIGVIEREIEMWIGKARAGEI